MFDMMRWVSGMVGGLLVGIFFIAGCYSRNVSPPISIDSPSRAQAVTEKREYVEGPPSPGDTYFETFKDTGEALCTDAEGRPVILLFSRPSCPHCQWIGDAFDSVVVDYVEKGLIAAHHYDLEVRDDLLTEAAEAGIPRAYIELGKRRDPEGYLPYFNFGCRYERFGNGYEESDDLNAEASEMKDVIEAILGE